MRNFNLANILTAVRIALTPLAVQTILTQRFRLALAIFFVAAATDGLDGLAARKLNLQTRFGAWLDPVADKLLLSASYLALGVCGAVPWWLVILIFARDVLILGMVGAALLWTAHRDFPPSIWGKISTSCQILAVVATLTKGAFALARLPLAPFFWLAAAATVWSGVGYVWRAAVLARRTVPPVTEPRA
jgi:cardiolipin synthase